MRRVVVPAQLRYAAEPAVPEKAAEAERDHDLRVALVGQRLDRARVEMVVVVVRDQQDIDRRQGFDRQAGRRETARPDYGKGTSCA